MARHQALCGLAIAAYLAHGICHASDTHTEVARPLRAVYVHLGEFANPTLPEPDRHVQIEHALDVIQDCGFDTLLAYANSSSGSVYYRSDRSPPATTVSHGTFDLLISAAQNRKLRVAPVVCTLVSGHDEPAGILLKHVDWALRDEQGNALGWISPAHPDARRWIVESLAELVAATEADSLLLDYFRYPNRPDLQLDATSAAEFDRTTPPNESPAEHQQRLQRFKEDALSTLLEELRQTLRAQHPKLTLGLYTWGAHVGSNHPVAQPWPRWVAQGQIDLVNVSGYCYRSNYGDDFLNVFEQRLRDASAAIDRETSQAQLTFALGLRTSHGTITTASQIADYLRIAEQLGVDGVAAFAWNGLEPIANDVIRGRYFHWPRREAASHQTVKLRVDLGSDRGQNFGSLFQAYDPQGRVVAGAGFLGAYNTYYRADRHALQFFVRPPTGHDRATVEPFPRPSNHTLHYLSDANGHVFASDRRGTTFELQSIDGQPRWQVLPEAPADRFRIADSELVCDTNQISIDDREVFQFDPHVGSAGSYYYAQGMLLFHVALANSADRRTRLYACPWNPASKSQVDLQRAIILELSTPGEFPYSYGQHGDDVIVGTNTGGVYRLRAGDWKTLLEPDMATSFQLYAMLNYHDRLLMGHYPSGELYEIVDDKVVQIEGWPPRPERASPRAREAQTLTLYRGELFVGVWPWGEIWRRRSPPAEWDLVGRLFQRPTITPEVTAPYEAELTAGGVAVNNLWGQRVTSLIPTGDMLLAATSNKGGTPSEEHAHLLSPVERDEYGEVYRVALPGHLSIPLNWSDDPFDLEIEFDARTATIRRQGQELSKVPLSAEAQMPVLQKIELARGVFGPFRGREVQGELAPSGDTNSVD